MQLIQAYFKDVMELNGRIDFPQGKAVVIYGANLQGKTNVINIIRYAFLKELKRGRKNYYDEWALPTREEVAPSNGSGEIQIIFEHEGNYYRLKRVITKNKADKPDLVQLSGWPGPVVKIIDSESFFKERLKVSLLDILFAPEISGGFKRLCGRDIEDAIGEIFKEVIFARRLAKSFNRRLEKLKLGANAKMVSIKSEYDKLVKSLINSCNDIETFNSFKYLKNYEVGKSYRKMENLEEEIRVRIQKLDETNSLTIIQDTLKDTETFDKLKRMLSNNKKIENYLKEIKKTKADKKELQNFIHSLQDIENPENTLIIPRFYDEQLQSFVSHILEKFEKSKKSLLEAKIKAKKLGIKIESINDDTKIQNELKEVKSVLTVLKIKKEIKEEKKAALTRINGKVHVVIPIKVLTSDPVYTKISSEPIPKCSEKERKKQIYELQLRKEMLLKILKELEKSRQMFSNIKKKDLQVLSEHQNKLEEKIKKFEDKIDDWLTTVTSNASLFLKKSQKKPKIESQKSLQIFVKQVTRAIELKKKEYLDNFNKNLQPLGIELEEFEKMKITTALEEFKKQKSNVPNYSNIIKRLNTEKEMWKSKDEEYADYLEIPKIVEESKKITDSIINNSVDEEKLREAIASTYVDIINKMTERRLIQAVAGISKERMKAEVTYKGKSITHPAGAEKAFFSLAILTALAYYFRMPVLIDEVANNLDSKNLRAFFDLVTELKNEKSVQYLLSVKETKDFDMEGWVKEIADELAIYQIKDKNITKI